MAFAEKPGRAIDYMDLTVDVYSADVRFQPTSLLLQLARELERIERSLHSIARAVPQVSFGEPENPQRGMVRYADGTDWNPGSGAGLYVYSGSAWGKITHA